MEAGGGELSFEEMSVIRDKHWNCFKGNMGETSERWGGVHMGFSKHRSIPS